MVTIPFYIMHAEMCSPGSSLHGNKSGCHILNTICDLIQLVISSVKTSPMAEQIATLSMEDFVLSYGMISVLVVDVNSQFKGTFKAMSKILSITY